MATAHMPRLASASGSCALLPAASNAAVIKVLVASLWCLTPMLATASVAAAAPLAGQPPEMAAEQIEHDNPEQQDELERPDNIKRPESIERIVVSGRGYQEPLRWSAANIHRQQLQPQLSYDSARFLQSLPGLQADSRSNLAQDTRLSVRGFGSRSAFGIRGIAILRDGISLNSVDGQGQLGSLFFDQIAAVEILSGPFAALYGNGAGAVLSFYQQPLTARRYQTQWVWQLDQPDAYARGSEFTPQQWRQQLQWAWQDGGMALGWLDMHSDGFRPQMRAEKQQQQLRLQHYWQDVWWHWQFDRADDPYLGDPQGLTLAQWRQTPYQTDASALRFNTYKTVQQQAHSLWLSPEQDIQQAPWQWAFWQSRRQIYQQLALPGTAISSSGGIVDLDRQLQGSQGRYQWPLQLAAVDRWLGHSAPWLVQLSGQWQQSREHRLGFVNAQGQAGDLRRDQWDNLSLYDMAWRLDSPAFGAWRWQLGQRLSRLHIDSDDQFIRPATASSSGNPDDSGQRRFSQQAYALGVNYQLSAVHSLYLSHGSGFEVPTLADLAYPSPTSATVGFNQQLQPSVNRQWELGWRWLPEPYSADDGSRAAMAWWQPTLLDIQFFSIENQDEIVVDSAVGGRTSYRNAGQTQRQGLQWSGQWQWHPSQRLSIHGWWQHHEFAAQSGSADPRLQTIAGKSLPGQTPRQLWAQWQWQLAPDWQLQWQAQWRSHSWADDANTAKVPGYAITDVSLQYNTAWYGIQLTPSVQLLNLTDKNYVSAVIVNQTSARYIEPAPGRQWLVALQLRYDW